MPDHILRYRLAETVAAVIDDQYAAWMLGATDSPPAEDRKAGVKRLIADVIAEFSV